MTYKRKPHCTRRYSKADLQIKFLAGMLAGETLMLIIIVIWRLS